jgi:carboxyl-terminal processing protease
MDKKEGTKKSWKLMPKVSGVTRGRAIAIIAVILAFIFGNVWGVTGRLNLIGSVTGSHFKSETGLPNNLDYSSVEKVYDLLRENYDGKLTQDQVLTGLKKGIAESANDPYTEYFTAKEAADFEGQINGTFTGIGAELGKDKDGNIIIVAPIADNPAEKAGLKAQDILATIDGQSTTGMSVDDAVSKIRGTKGTKVTLGIVRNQSQALSFTIVRDNIQIKSVKWNVDDNNIGYISISTFGSDTPDLIKQAATELKDKNVKGVILDLRGDPGGILDSAVAVASQWLPRGKTVLSERRGSVVLQTYQSDGPGTLQGIPTVVLIDQGSASASEITAGALKDSNVARLIGVKSYGKGVVQQPICIDGNQGADGSCPGAMLKVTVASWFRPNGQNINHQGIKPDQEVKPAEGDTTDGADAQKQAAIDYLNK